MATNHYFILDIVSLIPFKTRVDNVNFISTCIECRKNNLFFDKWWISSDFINHNLYKVFIDYKFRDIMMLFLDKIRKFRINNNNFDTRFFKHIDKIDFLHINTSINRDTNFKESEFPKKLKKLIVDKYDTHENVTIYSNYI